MRLHENFSLLAVAHNICLYLIVESVSFVLLRDVYAINP